MYAELTGNCKKQRIKSLCGNTLGWKTEDMLKGLPGVMTLAAAFGQDLGSVSGTVTDTMKAFGMQAGDSARMVDVLAQASISTNTSLDMMGKALQGAAPAASTFGYSVEDTAMAVGMMSDAGIQGEAAGESLKNLMTHLSEPTKLVQNYMDQLSVSLKDSSGEMKPFGTILSELKSGFSGLSDAQKEEYASGLAGKDGMAGFLAMMKGSDEEFIRLKDAMENSEGAAQKLSDVRLDNLAGDVSLFKGAYGETQLEIYAEMSDEVRLIMQKVTSYITDFRQRVDEETPTVIRQSKTLAKGLEQSFGTIINIGDWFANHSALTKGSVVGVIGSLATFKVVDMGTNLVKSISTAIEAWPVLLLGLAVGGIAGIGTAIKETERQITKANLEQHFGNLSLSVKELNEAAIKTLGSGLFQTIEKFSDAADKSEEIYRSMQDNLNDIEKNNWKISLGIELDSEDTASYDLAIQNYLKGAQEYLNSKGYELNLAIDLVYGDSEEGQLLKNNSNSFYQKQKQKLREKNSNINSLLEKRATDGLTNDEEEKLKADQLESVKLVELITDSQNKADFEMLKLKITDPNLSDDSFVNYKQAILDYNNKAMDSIDEAYNTIMTSIISQKSSGTISQDDYDLQMKQTKQSYYGRKLNVLMNGYSALKNTITDRYGAEVDPVLSTIQKNISDEVNGIIDSNNISTPEAWQNAIETIYYDAMESTNSLGSSKGVLVTLFSGLEESEEEINKVINLYKESGGNITNADLLDAESSLTDTNSWRAVSGVDENMWKLIGDKISEDENLSIGIMAARNNGAIYNDEVIDTISNKYPNANNLALNLIETMKNQYIDSNVNGMPVPINYKSIEMYTDTGYLEDRPTVIKDNAGNLDDKKDAGEDYRQNSRQNYYDFLDTLSIQENVGNLIRETENLKNSYQSNNFQDIYNSMVSPEHQTLNEDNSIFSPVFSPTIYINGSNNPTGELTGAVRLTYDQFKYYLERYNHEQSRTTFRR